MHRYTQDKFVSILGSYVEKNVCYHKYNKELKKKKKQYKNHYFYLSQIFIQQLYSPVYPGWFGPISIIDTLKGKGIRINE